MKVKATYRETGANPFVSDYRHFHAQFRYAEADNLPEDSDLKQLEELAKEKTPEGCYFIKIEVVR